MHCVERADTLLLLWNHMVAEFEGQLAVKDALAAQQFGLQLEFGTQSPVFLKVYESVFLVLPYAIGKFGLTEMLQGAVCDSPKPIGGGGPVITAPPKP